MKFRRIININVYGVKTITYDISCNKSEIQKIIDLLEEELK